MPYKGETKTKLVENSHLEAKELELLSEAENNVDHSLVVNLSGLVEVFEQVGTTLKIPFVS